MVSRWLLLDFCAFCLFFFLGGSCASSKCCSCSRRYSTCPTARSSIWDGESLLLHCSPSLAQPLLTRCWFAAPSRCRGAHDAPAAGDVRAAHDEAPVWSRRWPWCTGEHRCYANAELLSVPLESSSRVCVHYVSSALALGQGSAACLAANHMNHQESFCSCLV